MSLGSHAQDGKPAIPTMRLTSPRNDAALACAIEQARAACRTWRNLGEEDIALEVERAMNIARMMAISDAFADPCGQHWPSLS